jgi:hypothetical protein
MKTVFDLVWILVITACLPGCRTDAQLTDAQVTEPVAVGPDTFTLSSRTSSGGIAPAREQKLLSQQQTNNARDFRSNSYSSAVTRVLVLAQTKEW